MTHEWFCSRHDPRPGHHGFWGKFVYTWDGWLSHDWEDSKDGSESHDEAYATLQKRVKELPAKSVGRAFHLPWVARCLPQEITATVRPYDWMRFMCAGVLQFGDKATPGYNEKANKWLKQVYRAIRGGGGNRANAPYPMRRRAQRCAALSVLSRIRTDAEQAVINHALSSIGKLDHIANFGANIEGRIFAGSYAEEMTYLAVPPHDSCGHVFEISDSPTGRRRQLELRAKFHASLTATASVLDVAQNPLGMPYLIASTAIDAFSKFGVVCLSALLLLDDKWLAFYASAATVVGGMIILYLTHHRVRDVVTAERRWFYVFVVIGIVLLCAYFSERSGVGHDVQLASHLLDGQGFLLALFAAVYGMLRLRAAKAALRRALPVYRQTDQQAADKADTRWRLVQFFFPRIL